MLQFSTHLKIWMSADLKLKICSGVMKLLAGSVLHIWQLDALCTFSRNHRISDSKMLNPDSLTALPKSPWVRDQPNMVNIALFHGETKSALRSQVTHGVPFLTKT